MSLILQVCLTNSNVYDSGIFQCVPISLNVIEIKQSWWIIYHFCDWHVHTLTKMQQIKHIHAIKKMFNSNQSRQKEINFIGSQKVGNQAQESNKMDLNIWIFFLLFFEIHGCGCRASGGSFPGLFPKQAHKGDRTLEERYHMSGRQRKAQPEALYTVRGPGPSGGSSSPHVSREDESHLTIMKQGQIFSLIKTAVIWKMGTWHKEEINYTY